ncbi:MAG: 16S rRNA (adenine(1518)-N(6)/adenine(1519)-N(6))-dimethyltransferase RsmA [Miltoncostaeaceae bacterium]
MSEEPPRPADPPPRVGVMRLLERHGLRPDTDLGQHFLLDENLVDLAVRRAGVGPRDVAVEVGPGLGVLTVALARAAAHVHALEFDRRVEPVLAEVLAGAGNVTVHWGDAMRADLAALAPAPTVMVANLPYNIATPIMVESLWRLPAVERWCVMTQAEVADRWTAAPGGRLYGAPTVLMGMAMETTFRRAVGREVFVPRPRVDSALVAFRRSGPAPAPGVRDLVRAAFASRRKTLANTLGAAGHPKEAVRRILIALGHPADARPEALAPSHYATLAARLAEGDR